MPNIDEITRANAVDGETPAPLCPFCEKADAVVVDPWHDAKVYESPAPLVCKRCSETCPCGGHVPTEGHWTGCEHYVDPEATWLAKRSTGLGKNA